MKKVWVLCLFALIGLNLFLLFSIYHQAVAYGLRGEALSAKIEKIFFNLPFYAIYTIILLLDIIAGIIVFIRNPFSGKIMQTIYLILLAALLVVIGMFAL